MLRRLRLGLSIATCMLVIGCSTVEPIGDSGVHSPSSADCDVTVHQTYQQAIKRGPIEELCIINGTSSGSFSHTVQTAINKHKNKACGCGATNVYIQSRSDSGWDVATVSLVAFRYVVQQSPQ
jgi:hypothetical protein